MPPLVKDPINRCYCITQAGFDSFYDHHYGENCEFSPFGTQTNIFNFYGDVIGDVNGFNYANDCDDDEPHEEVNFAWNEGSMECTKTTTILIKGVAIENEEIVDPSECCSAG